MPEKIHHLSDTSEAYPPLLREIAQPPTDLYVRGNLELLQHHQLLAVVGSRAATYYGKQVIAKLLPPIVQAGVPLVSGLAYGIDSLAHQICTANQQPTIAVLGSGIDDESIYPRRHISLAHEIIATGGTLVDEYTPGTPADKFRFPERNRLIAGLTQATLVVQATRRSGSLITARLALEANRDVCAVPGKITDKMSVGTNDLIRQGAIPILKPADLLAVFDLELPTTSAPKLSVANLTKHQYMVYLTLGDRPLHIDLITAKTKLTAPDIAAALAELELLAAVENVGGMRYVKGTTHAPTV